MLRTGGRYQPAGRRSSVRHRWQRGSRRTTCGPIPAAARSPRPRGVLARSPGVVTRVVRPHPVSISQRSSPIAVRCGLFLLGARPVLSDLLLQRDQAVVKIQRGLNHAFLADLRGGGVGIIGLLGSSLERASRVLQPGRTGAQMCRDLISSDRVVYRAEFVAGGSARFSRGGHLRSGPLECRCDFSHPGRHPMPPVLGGLVSQLCRLTTQQFRRGCRLGQQLTGTLNLRLERRRRFGHRWKLSDTRTGSPADPRGRPRAMSLARSRPRPFVSRCRRRSPRSDGRVGRPQTGPAPRGDG